MNGIITTKMEHRLPIGKWLVESGSGVMQKWLQAAGISSTTSTGNFNSGGIIGRKSTETGTISTIMVWYPMTL